MGRYIAILVSADHAHSKHIRLLIADSVCLDLGLFVKLHLSAHVCTIYDEIW